MTSIALQGHSRSNWLLRRKYKQYAVQATHFSSELQISLYSAISLLYVMNLIKNVVKK